MPKSLRTLFGFMVFFMVATLIVITGLITAAVLLINGF